MKNTFKTRPLGKTYIEVSTLGFGAASMGNLYQAVSDEEAKNTLTAAIDVGISLFDTAPRYGAGLSERRVGDALRGLDKKEYILSTKVGRFDQT
ncbi:aldo/keto reductase [Pseudoalteromonas gelatinilytica]